MTTAKVTKAFAELNEIETFVRVRTTLDFAEEGPRRLKMQLLARGIGDAWAGQLSAPALATMQHAYMLKDLLTSFGSRERITDWTTVCLAHIRDLRALLERIDPSATDVQTQIVEPHRGTFC